MYNQQGKRYCPGGYMFVLSPTREYVLLIINAVYKVPTPIPRWPSPMYTQSQIMIICRSFSVVHVPILVLLSFTPLSVQHSSHRTTMNLSFHVWIIPILGRNTMGDCVRPTLFPIRSDPPPPPPLKSGPTLTMAKQTKIPRLRPEAALSCNTLEATAIPNYWIYSRCQEILRVQLSENILRVIVRKYKEGRRRQELYWESRV